MTAEQYVFLLAQLAVFLLALVGLIVVTGAVALTVHDRHAAGLARVAAYTGGPVRPTHRHTRSNRG